MARIKFSALVESIQGSIAGTTFQRNAYGFSVKSKPNMIRPNKARQNASKNRFSSLTKQWGGMTQSQRNAWITYASSFPVPSRLNPDSNLNGFNYFVKYHNLRFTAGSSGIVTSPGATQATIDYSVGDMINTGSSLFYEGDCTVSSGSFILAVYLTPEVPAGKVFVPTTPRFIRASPISADAYSVDLGANYEALFNALPTIGSNIGIKVVIFGSSTGQFQVVSNTLIEVIS